MAQSTKETTETEKSKRDPFKEVIQAYLNKRAEEDDLFAATLKKANKKVKKKSRFFTAKLRKMYGTPFDSV